MNIFYSIIISFDTFFFKTYNNIEIIPFKIDIKIKIVLFERSRDQGHFWVTWKSGGENNFLKWKVNIV